MRKMFMATVLVFLTGCPPQEGECRTVLKCNQDREMLCEESRSRDCGEDCHYYVFEHCMEVCE